MKNIKNYEINTTKKSIFKYKPHVVDLLNFYTITNTYKLTKYTYIHLEQLPFVHFCFVCWKSLFVIVVVVFISSQAYYV